jgi:hypothetical protein
MAVDGSTGPRSALQVEDACPKQNSTHLLRETQSASTFLPDSPFE